jgi:hypothetical protein
VSTDDELGQICQVDDRTVRVGRFRRAAADALAVFDALASQQSPTTLRNAVMGLDEAGAKRALIAAALERRAREVSAAEHYEWMRSDAQLDLDLFRPD